MAKYCKCPRQKKEKDDSLNAVKEKERDKQFILNTIDTKADSKKIWLLDSGASTHSCCLEEIFISNLNLVSKFVWTNYTQQNLALLSICENQENSKTSKNLCQSRLWSV